MDTAELLLRFERAENHENLRFWSALKMNEYLREIQSDVAMGECSQWSAAACSTRVKALRKARDEVSLRYNFNTTAASAFVAAIMPFATMVTAIAKLPHSMTEWGTRHWVWAGLSLLFMIVSGICVYSYLVSRLNGWTSVIKEYDMVIQSLNAVTEKKLDEENKDRHELKDKVIVPVDGVYVEKLVKIGRR